MCTSQIQLRNSHFISLRPKEKSERSFSHHKVPVSNKRWFYGQCSGGRRGGLCQVGNSREEVSFVGDQTVDKINAREIRNEGMILMIKAVRTFNLSLSLTLLFTFLTYTENVKAINFSEFY